MMFKIFMSLFILSLLQWAIDAHATSIDEISSQLGFAPGSYRLEKGDKECLVGDYEFRPAAEDTLAFYVNNTALAIEIGGEAFSETDTEGCTYLSESTVAEKRVIYTHRKTCADQVKLTIRRTIDFEPSKLVISEVSSIDEKTQTNKCELVRFKAERVEFGPVQPIVTPIEGDEKPPIVTIDETN
jgi:hypothetical protein